MTNLFLLDYEGVVHDHALAAQQLALHSLLWFSARVVLGSLMKTDRRLSLGPRTQLAFSNIYFACTPTGFVLSGKHGVCGGTKATYSPS